MISLHQCFQLAIAVSIFASGHGELHGYISAYNTPFKVYIDGVQASLPYNDTWYVHDRINLGNLAPGSCVSVAVRYANRKLNGWIKAVFDNGVETDSTWKCSSRLERRWFAKDFDDSHWSSPGVDAYGRYKWYWDQSSKQDYLDAPLIWFDNIGIGTRGGRFCRKQICNKCPAATCYDCENNNPCNPLMETDVYQYPHNNPNRFVQCTYNGGCSVDNSELVGYISANYNPITVYVNGVKTPLMNSQYWDVPGKLILGNLNKDGCITLAISYNEILNGGWIKGTFSNGGKTDTTWKCSVTAYQNWEQPGFDDSAWQAPDIYADGRPFWGWGASSRASFINAPIIWFAGNDPDGLRYCRKTFCPGPYDCGQNNPCRPQGPQYFPHPDKTKYVQCGVGTCTVKNCSNGLVWDPTIEGCNWP